MPNNNIDTTQTVRYGHCQSYCYLFVFKMIGCCLGGTNVVLNCSSIFVFIIIYYVRTTIRAYAYLFICFYSLGDCYIFYIVFIAIVICSSYLFYLCIGMMSRLDIRV